MSKIYLLDSGPLGFACNPSGSPKSRSFSQWLGRQLMRGIRVHVPEVTDYEVRRELIRSNRARSIAKLDGLNATLGYLPITTPVMRKAAELWAQARNMGRQTAHNLRLDADMILAAQAALLIEVGHEVTIITPNASHLSLFVPAADWQSIP